VTVAFNVRGRDVESMVAEIQALCDRKLNLPEGYSLSIGGQFKNLKEAKARLQIAVPAALGLIFVLLFFTFGSIKQSLLIFTAIPLSAIGGIFAIWLRDMPFSISAGVGFIALFGVAVLNGIVLMSEFNRMRKKGEDSVDEVIIKSTQVRLRPVLMTALVASLGFLPMALSSGAGAEVQKPLATVVIGGLFSATVLTLLVLPVLYKLTENKKISPAPLLSSFLLLLFFLPVLMKAQENKPKMTYAEALQKALVNHPSIQSAQLHFESKQKLKGSANEWGKFQAGVQIGQYNSYYTDQNFTIGQTVPFPTVFGKLKDLLEKQAKEAGMLKQIKEQSIRFDLRLGFENLYFNRSRVRYLRQLDSIYLFAEKAAILRFEKGETNQVESILAKSKLQEIRSLIQQGNGEIELALIQIRNLCQIQEPMDFVETSVLAEPYAMEQNTGPVLDSNLLVRLSVSEKESAMASWQLEKTRLLPDFSLGYFNQSLQGIPLRNGELAQGSNRFQGFSAGVQFPIWQKPLRQKIKSAELEVRSKEKNTEAVISQIRSEMEQVQNQIKVQKEVLSYLETSAFPTALLLQKTAFKNFESGNSGILPLQQSLEQSLKTEEQILNARYQLALKILQIQFLKSSSF
jgi:cobalt-zinc-cadmium resistance protein CzcA